MVSPGLARYGFLRLGAIWKILPVEVNRIFYDDSKYIELHLSLYAYSY